MLSITTGITFSQQALPFSDSFSYPAGNLHTTAPWSVVGTIPTPEDHILLDGSKVTFAGGGTDAQVLITNQTTGTVFYKLTLNVVSMTGVTNIDNGYLAGFAQSSSAFGGTLWTKRVDDTNFNIGIEVRTAIGTNTTFTATSYPVGTPLNIVVSYTFNTGTTMDDVCKLWINPTSNDEASPLLTDTHVGADLTSILSFFLRQDSPSETPSVTIDDLKIANTFSETLSSDVFNTIDGFKTYPNPVTNGVLNITTSSNDIKTVEIFDIAGKQVFNQTISNQEVNVSNLKTGVYMLKVTENNKVSTQKLMVK